MEMFYFWVQDYRNISRTGFNLSSKVQFNCEVNSVNQDGSFDLSLSHQVVDNGMELLPSNILDIKTFVGQNGTGKTNILFYLLNFLMNKEPSKINGFLITNNYIFIRGKYNINNIPAQLFEKQIEVINNADIFNFYKKDRDKKLTEEQANSGKKFNLFETFFKDEYLIFYSNILNQDNFYNIDGIANSYALWENQLQNYFDISTEASIVQDYNNNNVGQSYFLTGESEMLSYKSGESLRALSFLSKKELQPSIPFENFGIHVSFNDFNSKYWHGIEYLVSRNEPYSGIISRTLQQHDDKISAKESTSKESFYNELYKNILFTILKFQLKYYSDFRPNETRPLFDLLKHFENNYAPSDNAREALINYARTIEELNTVDFVYILTYIEKYFEDKFKTGTLLCNGIYGFLIPAMFAADTANDFLTEPLIGIKTEHDFIRFNFFTFDFYGLSSGQRAFLSLFSRINAIKEKVKDEGNVIYFLVDEGEIGFHPQWQKAYLKILVDFLKVYFAGNKIQLILTTHSPFLVSDLPKKHFVFLENIEGKCKISDLRGYQETFGANIHSLYTDAFFLSGALIGDLAKSKIDELINYLQNNEYTDEKTANYRKILDAIGEPVIKYKLEELWIEKLGKKEEVLILRRRLNKLEGNGPNP